MAIQMERMEARKRAKAEAAAKAQAVSVENSEGGGVSDEPDTESDS